MAKEGEKGHWGRESGSSTLLIPFLKDSPIALIRKREQDEDARQGTGLASPPHVADDETEAQAHP